MTFDGGIAVVSDKNALDRPVATDKLAVLLKIIISVMSRNHSEG